MSENYEPKGGTPSPYGNPNPHIGSTPPQQPPVYFDPNQNSNAVYAPEHVITGNPGIGNSSYAYPAYAPGRNLGAISRKEANMKATIALVLGIVSFFTVGLILSIPGYLLAREAELVNAENAKAAKIVNLISIGVNAVLGLLFVLLIVIAGANHLQ